MKTDQKVALIRIDGTDSGITGAIAGIGHILERGDTRPIYIVKLDEGFYGPGEKLYISMIVVDRTSLRPIE